MSEHVKTPKTKAQYVKLEHSNSPYWIFEAESVLDVLFPEAWINVARFCRWWVGDNQDSNELRIVSGILQLTSPMSSSDLRDLLPSTVHFNLLPCTLRHQASFLPIADSYEYFYQYEYGDQRHPKQAKPLNLGSHSLTPAQRKYASIAISKGMDVNQAADPAKVVEFFRIRREGKAKSANPLTPVPPPAKKRRTQPPHAPQKHLTQSLGSIPDPHIPDDDSDCHITDDDELNNLL